MRGKLSPQKNVPSTSIKIAWLRCVGGVEVINLSKKGRRFAGANAFGLGEKVRAKEENAEFENSEFRSSILGSKDRKVGAIAPQCPLRVERAEA